MVPTTIEAAELSQAIATGVAESIVSSGSTGYDRKHWEKVDYCYDMQAWSPRNMVTVNGRAWDSLNEDAQAANAKSACWSSQAGTRSSSPRKA